PPRRDTVRCRAARCSAIAFPTSVNSSGTSITNLAITPPAFQSKPGSMFLAHSRRNVQNESHTPVIPHREENIMAIAVALDDDLVGAAPQHRATPPTLAPVYLI